MSEQSTPTIATVPSWDVADRMRKSLRVSGMSVQEMADYLGVARNTVGTWINGRIQPGAQTLRLWAMRTGVPHEWLRDGIESVTSPDPDGMGSDLGITESGWIADAPGQVVDLFERRAA